MNLTGVKFCSVNYLGHQLSDQAIAAYWLETYGLKVDHHREQIARNFKELADLLGFTVVEDSAEAPTDEAAS